MNSKNKWGETAFHLACCSLKDFDVFDFYSEIAEMIFKNASELKIDLNSKNNNGQTGFHVACTNSHIRMVDMMIEQSESLKLDLKAEDSNGKTGFQMAKGYEKTDVVNLIQTEMPSLAEIRESPISTVSTRFHFLSCIN